MTFLYQIETTLMPLLKSQHLTFRTIWTIFLSTVRPAPIISSTFTYAYTLLVCVRPRVLPAP